jgi:hypothetical protein
MPKKTINGLYIRNHDDAVVTAREVAEAERVDLLIANPGDLVVTDPSGSETVWQSRAFLKHHSPKKKPRTTKNGNRKRRNSSK